MLCQKKILHESRTIGRGIVMMKLICWFGHYECDGHTVHKLSQRRLTAYWLAPRESDCSRMNSKVSSDWLPSYIKATRMLLEIFKMAGYFPDSPRTCYFVQCYLPWRCRTFNTLYKSAWTRGICYSGSKSIDSTKVRKESRCFVIRSCLSAGQCPAFTAFFFIVCLFVSSRGQWYRRLSRFGLLGSFKNISNYKRVDGI